MSEAVRHVRGARRPHGDLREGIRSGTKSLEVQSSHHRPREAGMSHEVAWQYLKVCMQSRERAQSPATSQFSRRKAATSWLIPWFGLLANLTTFNPSRVLALESATYAISLSKLL